MTTIGSFDSGHFDSVHDAQFDYYGKRVATCSSDQSIKIHDVQQNAQAQYQVNYNTSQELKGHQGPVWQVQWANPKFGNLLASCGFDNKVIIWKEQLNKQWIQAYQYSSFGGSVNSINFAPVIQGLVLVCACMDGHIYLLEHQGGGSWVTDKVPNAHSMGVTSVCFAPHTHSQGDQQSQQIANKKFVSGGFDSLVKVWEQGPNGMWNHTSLDGHTDIVNDVQWAPQFGTSPNIIASAGQDGKVVIWSQNVQNAWSSDILNDFGIPVHRLSFSSVGNILAVTSGKNQVSLWKQLQDGSWSILQESLQQPMDQQLGL